MWPNTINLYVNGIRCSKARSVSRQANWHKTVYPSTHRWHETENQQLDRGRGVRDEVATATRTLKKEEQSWPKQVFKQKFRIFASFYHPKFCTKCTGLFQLHIKIGSTSQRKWTMVWSASLSSWFPTAFRPVLQDGLVMWSFCPRRWMRLYIEWLWFPFTPLFFAQCSYLYRPACTI